MLDPRAGPVHGDPDRLQQVVWNLLSNAIKFTPKGGRVQVVLARVNSHAEVRVSDSGQGIDPAFLPHVFDRFRQADGSTTRKHGGLGLGLAIVRHLVELHGGTVRAESAGAGQGATFVVTLPVAAVQLGADDDGAVGLERRTAGADGDLPAAPPPPESNARRAQLAGVRVLVVDDEPDARALARRLLEECHAAVETAGSAAEAFAALRRGAFDVLLSDIGMPEEDGYGLIRQVRALPPEQGGRVPAAALTAYARSGDRTRALLAGYQTHLSKPVEPGELIATVASLAGRVS